MNDRDFGVDLYWIPLGAGGHFVRFNGMVYEAIAALLEHRLRLDVYHSALEITVPTGHFTVEMTPIPTTRVSARGVVAEGPVGMRALSRFRIFRYEVRRWRDGVIPDLPYAVASPVRVTADVGAAMRVLDLVPHVPRLVWGRDELHAGEMWSCNSIISWVLTSAELDAAAVPMPVHARAPGWDAGIAIARRGIVNLSPRRRRRLPGAVPGARVPAA
jgi:hypothetical protein